MKRNDVVTIDGRSQRIAYVEVSECPICKRSIKPELLKTYGYSDNSSHKYVSMMYLCHGCFNTFLAKYYVDADNSAELQYCGPSEHEDRKFDERISEISPQFVKIYNQAKSAEEYGLDEICGIGYRKSLEFLVKDYLCHKNPEDSEQIKTMMLGQVISTKIADDDIKATASRCAWLGNDQTHYVQKFEEYDLDMLKKLLDAVVYWVSMKLMTEVALEIDKR